MPPKWTVTETDFASGLDPSITGQITGLITFGEEHLPLPNALVTLGTEELRTGTDAEGWHILPHVPEGLYTIQIFCDGFATLKIEDVECAPWKRLWIDANMERAAAAIGSAAPSVTEPYLHELNQQQIEQIAGGRRNSDFGEIRGLCLCSEDHTPIVGGSIALEGTRFGALSNIDGEFHIILVPPGTYNIMALLPGCIPKIVESVKVRKGQLTRVYISMQPAEVHIESEEIGGRE